MKKAIISALLISVLILGGSSAAIAVRNSNDNKTNSVFVAVETELTQSAKSSVTPVNETVYAITDADGGVNKSFVNNTLNTSSEVLPVSVHATYYMDGVEMSPAEMAGKSGHVKVVFSYTAQKVAANGKYVPFVIVTGMKLDETKFKNVVLDNGKIVSENNDLMVVGYATAGLNENLGTTLLPASFTIEADVTDFELGESYTLATSELIADLDTSKLSKADEIISAINQLASGMNQLVAGSSALSGGASALYNGIVELQGGVAQLNTGAHQLAVGASQVADGVGQLVDLNDKIFGGVFEIADNLEAKIDEYAEEYNIPEEAVARLKELLKQLSGPIGEAYDKLVEYTDGVKQLSDGANQVSNGASQLAGGLNQLVVGVEKLKSGASQLAGGANTLHNGLLTFKSSGIDRLTSFANNDLRGFVNNFRASVEAARSYKYYQNASSKSVKFIFKTTGVKQ